MKLFGLIGYPVEQSFSAKYFNEKFAELGLSDHRYDLFPLEDIDWLPALLDAHPDLVGLNVTTPHKLSVQQYVHALDEVAWLTGSVNVLRISRHQGKRLIEGFNSDYSGFKLSLQPLLSPAHNNALILGTGGSSLTVAAALKELRIPFRYVSRTARGESLNYSELTPKIISECRLIINCTPLGMWPHMGEKPAIPYEGIGKDHLLYDLIYNPAETQFLAEGRKRGARTKNGLEMLKIQAEVSWDIWR